MRLSTLIFFAVIGFLFFSSKTNAQTNGTLTFTFTQNVPGTSTKNLIAVWVEDNSGAFIKTKLKYCSSGNIDHLTTWANKSGQNVVDAISGATLTASTSPTAFGVKTAVWDGKNVSNVTVGDGTYKVFVETAWGSPNPASGQHNDIISFSFTKGSSAVHLTPAGNTNFNNITLDWIPLATAINLETINGFVSVYPTLSNGNVRVNFKQSSIVSRILVENIYGEVVFQKTYNKSMSGEELLNLQNLSDGIYFIEVLFKDNISQYKSKVILKK